MTDRRPGTGSNPETQFSVRLNAPTTPRISWWRTNSRLTWPNRSVTTRRPYSNIPAEAFSTRPSVMSSVSTAIWPAWMR